MAYTAYGVSGWYAYGSGGNARAVVAIDGVPNAGDITAATASVTLTQRLHLESDKSLVDSSNLGYIRWQSSDPGQSASNVNVNHGSSGGSTMFLSRSRVINTSYDSAINVYAAAVIQGITAVGTDMTVAEFSVVIPRRPYGTPSSLYAPAVSVTASSGTISWSGPDDWGGSPASKYWFQWSTSSDFSSYTTVVINAPTSSVTVTGLNPNQTYYFRVQAYNTDLGNGGGAGSLLYGSWTTLANLPTIPASSSVSNITVSSARIAFTSPTDWGGDNTGNYTVQVYTDSSYTNQVWASTNASGTTRDVTGLDNGQTYYYRVGAVNSAGTGPWRTGSFTTLSGVPSNPGAPSVTGVAATTANMAWSASSTANGGGHITYEWQLSTVSNFSSIAKSGSTTATSVALTGLTPGVTYYSRVRATTTYGQSSYVTGTTFTTPSAPTSAPVLSLTNAGPISPAVSWTAISNWGAATGTYTLRYRVAGGSWTTVTGLTSTSYTLPTLSPNTAYEAQVWGVNTYGAGPTSNTLSWTTSAPPVYTKVSGTWRPSAAVYVKVSGVWRTAVRVWVKVSGTWR